MKKKMILLALLLGLGLMLGQPNVSTDGGWSMAVGGLFVPCLALASGAVAQQPRIVLRNDGPEDLCLVIDPNTNTACFRFSDGTTIAVLSDLMA